MTEPYEAFNYDLDRMEYMLDTEFITMPSELNTVEEIMKWLKGGYETEDNESKKP